MMEENSHAENGLLSTVADFFKTAREAAENRVELLIVEWREERLRLISALMLLLVGAVTALMTLVLVTFIIVVIFWETHRLLVLILLAAIYAGVTVAAFWTLRSRTRQWKAFDATLEEMKKDRACFKNQK